MSKGYGLMAATLAAAMIGSLGGPPITVDRIHREPTYPPLDPPQDHGPVTDSSKESKRARRRRLAKEGQP
jgi:hypothetical protein